LIPLLALALLACGGARSLNKKADSYYDDGRYLAAARTYERALEKKPGEPHALVGVSRSWVAAGQPQKAIVPAQVAVEKKANGAVEAYAKALIASGRGTEALAAAEQAIAEGGKDPAFHALIAEVRLAMGDLPAARTAADAAVAGGGDGGDQALAAWIHARSGVCSSAMPLASQASTLGINDMSIQAEAAAVYRMCGDRTRAEALASEARALALDGGKRLVEEANLRLTGGDAEGAIRKLYALRTVYPEDGVYAQQLGYVWLKLRAWDRASVELSAALKLDPFFTGTTVGGVQAVSASNSAMTPEERARAVSEIWGALADARQGMNDLRGMASAREQSMLARGKPSAQEWMVQADLWDRARDPEAAIRAARFAVELDPNLLGAHLLCSRLYTLQGDLDRAIGHGRRVWELNPGHVENALSLAKLQLSRGDTNEARRVLEVSLARVPGDKRLAEALAKVKGYGG
jgi:tetratricopeptide (TPR) repeat protein